MTTLDSDDLELLRGYECPSCGPLVDETGKTLTDDEALDIMGGDERCPDCGEELEQTMEALLGVLQMVAERFPEVAPAIADRLTGAP